ncbi:MAG: EAL domain-containing protein, partial [Lachnospiraceae bacterium]|nr:EAL domain-containing protein [Lachnospiraceae bacterium]
VAERTGEILEVGRQIFERVCSFIQSASLRERGLAFVNVNLSPAQCMNEQLVSEFSEIAVRHSVSMNMIDFEITESTADDAGTVRTQIIRLQQSGAEISIDDFGTGTSNLTRLMELPIHVVKLDMSVAHAYFSGETGFLPDLIRMFKNAGLKVVVEGVETEEMKDALTKMGCDYLQGYYFSKPVPPEEFEKLIG